MAKKKDNTSRIKAIVAAFAQDSGSVSNSDLSLLQRYINSHPDFAEWFQGNFGTTRVVVSRGSVKNAKDAYNTYGFTPTPQRGKNGQDTASMIYRSGMRTNQTEPVSDVAIEKVENRSEGRRDMFTATPEGGRTRTDAELKSIIRRGQLGATLNLEDQRIYDRWVTMQREQADAERKEKANAAISKQKAKDRADKFQYLGMEDDGTLNDLQIEALMKRKEKNDAAADEDERKLAYAKALAAQEAEALRQERVRELGLEEGAAISDEEYKRIVENRGYELPDDYVMNENERQALKKGTKRTAYSANDQREIDAMDAEVNEKIRSGKYTQDEIDQIRRITENAKKQWYRKQVEDTPVEELTGDQAWDKTRTREMADGSIVAQDENGKWYTVWKPDTKESAEDKLESERKKYLLGKVEKDRKGFDNTSQYLDDETTENPNYGKEFDSQQSIKDANANWEAVYGGKDYAKYGLDWDTSEVTPDSVEAQDEWVFGSDYNADVAHGYTGSYDDWLAEFGGGGAAGAAPAEPVGHMKSSYL